MRLSSKVLTFFALTLLVPGITLADGQFARETGPGDGTLVAGGEGTDCGSLVFYSDGTYENGYAWSYGGVVEPDYGIFAECISGPVRLCSVVADLTKIQETGFLTDIFVYGDDGGIPGAVIATYPDSETGPIADWPSVSRHVFPVEIDCVEDVVYVGLGWLEASSGVDGYFLAADLDGPGGGCTLTNIAPGIGWPTGWNDVSVVWGPTQALGLGAETLPCDPVPTLETSWGRIKTLY